ncbi:MAG: tetratricopeptide repeat protein [Azonexus sp.]
MRRFLAALVGSVLLFSAGLAAALPASAEFTAVLEPRLKLVQLMVESAARGDENALLDLRNMVEELPFVGRGQRREARKLNTQGLGLLAQQQFGPAIEALVRARDTDPADAEIANNLGYAHYKAGQLAAAEKILRETLAIAPGRAAAWGNLGDLFAVLGQSDRAVAAYRNAYRFSRAPDKTLNYFRQQQQNDASTSVRQALAVALPLLGANGKVSNDGDRSAVIGRRTSEPEALGAARSSPPVVANLALFRAARNGDAAALKQLRQSAGDGDPDAQRLMGYIYDRGYGVVADPALAASWLKRSADQGYPPGLYGYAWSLNHGIGVGRNDAEAFRLYRQAAEQGYIYAQNNLAVAYDRGEGTEKDPGEAFRWFRSAADGGDLLAQLNLGRLYEAGRGTTQDLAQATRWYLAAAGKGLATAQFKCAVMLEYGKGVARDLPQAIEWYRKAAEQGVEPARDALKRLGALD